MSWRWAGEPPAAEGPDLGRTFTSQGEAETWLGEYFPDLAEAGVATVTLYEEDRLVYGPMSLEPDLG